MKLRDEVGMAGPKSAQTRFVGIIASTICPMLAFLDEKFMLSRLVDVGGGGGR